MKISKILIPIIVLSGLGYLVYAQLSENKVVIEERSAPRKEVNLEMPVSIYTATTSEFNDSLNFNGTFEAKKELSVIAESSGRITDLFVKEGQRISKGQVIAKIDDASIKAQMDMINAQLDKTKNDVSSYERLLKAGAISEQQYEEVKLSLKNIEANLAATTQQLKYTTLVAPMSGVIQSIPVEQGSFATPGTQIANVVDISSLKMVIQVPEKDVVKLRTGQKVNIQTEVYPEKSFTGVISLIAVQADAARKYNVEIELPVSPSFPLKPGMFGNVSINTSSEPTLALFIPRKSIVGSIQNPEVFVVSNRKAMKKSIKIGQVKGSLIEVTKGVQEGDQVVISGQVNLEEGTTVQITSSENQDQNSNFKQLSE
ncbi:efflux RND transporter periplasmic adaptor subunit [Membranihabitans maritimus]|uniref:efflux RND transporter periplasmic adaptor subunit n=1 Tax=Membranihabitans maritimus TaxID=2904244 RepID=UPI001F0077EF|nr:efflux RND transporter periplasmic adaptor subunit [Membranihabitans maritimus]